MVQFTNAIILYTIASNITNNQFLYDDLVVTIPLSMFMGWTGPFQRLTSQRPPGSLLSLPVLCSVFGAVIIQFMF